VRFLIDAQLPPALARYFNEQGFEASAVRELSLRDADDAVIWEAARAAGCIVLTKDEDFAEKVRRLGAPPQVMWLRIGNATNRALLAWLMPLLPNALAALGRGDALVELV
jgi:predicted nuclease of predicted toxin-antitoxin system